MNIGNFRHIYIYIYIYMHIKLKSAKYLKKIVPTVQMRLDMATREAGPLFNVNARNNSQFIKNKYITWCILLKFK
jgi:hypothetical protein